MIGFIVNMFLVFVNVVTGLWAVDNGQDPILNVISGGFCFFMGLLCLAMDY